MPSLHKIIIIFSFLGLISCATIIRGTSEDFKVTTLPEGAKVSTTLETAQSYKARKKDPSRLPIYHGCPETPCAFKVPRRSKFIARIEKEGFQTGRLIVRSRASFGGQGIGTVGTTATVASPYVVELAGTAALSGTAATTLIASGISVLASPLIATDAVSGAMLSLYPNPVALQLIPLSENTEVNYDLDQLTDSNQTYARSKNNKK